ncbi:hypothetical protein QBC46DRAFT_319855 [Diplogelasinospora grovesii]|uniref:Uncharacterized protein n=1 Tax=Diplogelasinospora grovesii TaxID=303347 RepID=A0AAN6N3U8_9PEZI|nr:hypothetical protein QBC46DRAFT_319855 [Diplogelasinospora grovesii]
MSTSRYDARPPPPKWTIIPETETDTSENGNVNARSSKANVVPLDPQNNTFQPRPCIFTILRTGKCPGGTILLVESLEENISTAAGNRTVQLVLGDGVLCIQALLAPELHELVDDGTIFEGCYVRVDKFELRKKWLPPAEPPSAQWDIEDDGSLDPAKMVFLVIRECEVIGWDRAYMDILRQEDEKELPPISAKKGSFPQPERAPEEGPKTLEKGKGEEILAPQQPPTKAAPKINLEPDPDEEEAFEQMQVELGRATQRREEQRTVRFSDQPKPGAPPPKKDPPYIPDDPTQPLKLTQLRSIPNLPYKQNWMVNVLAIVVSLSEVMPCPLPPPLNIQRNARLADPSTSKQVLLNVFLDPEEFNPKIGSVVLLVGVKNHQFDGGSLKKYPSDKPTNGMRWWLENPEHLGWCDVGGLRGWWEEKQRQQRQEGSST